MKTGDVVRLKSGGPSMTVRYEIDEKASLATGNQIGVLCDWFDTGGNPHEKVFKTDQIYQIEQDQ